MKDDIKNDNYLFQQFKQNREEGFKLIVIKYRERLYFHIRRILIVHEDSDDALQNTFVQAWQKLHTFKEESSLFTWLYKIATNEALLVLRKRKELLSFDSGNLESIFSNHPEGDSWFDGDEAFKKLLDAIRSLPEKQQLVFNMKYFDNLKYDEIEEILGTSIGALKASYHHARKKIEDLLKDD